ncbi:MAG TPA: trypsin-like peptidase domain-containing protein [Planctomycetota bacterium]|nr:trypsin-like peptidase domain-containing protein [Planctomycetota bacterium]
MQSGLRIRLPDGTTKEFGPDREVVRIGRDASRCDVALPEDASTVSREHCELRRSLGRYRLVTGPDHLVLVDGEEAHDGRLLPGTCTLQLGRGGPALALEVLESGGHRPTVGAREGRPGVETRLETLRSRVRSVDRRTAGGVLLGAVALCAGAVGYFLADRRISDAAVVFARETGRLEARLDLVHQEALERSARAKDDFSAVFQRVEPSVYLVVRVIRSGADEYANAFGTAFSVGPGVLATNAHVAAEFDALGANGEMRVRSTGTAPHDLVVERVGLHPGYAVFEADVRQSGLFDLAAASSLDPVPACDVALLYLADSDRAGLAPPLELAPHAALTELRSGQPVAFVGFPSEGIVRGGTDIRHPRATLQIGHLTSTSDFFMARAEPDFSHLVHFSMPSAGGASGSPVFDREGRVVAILSAGNIVGMVGEARVAVPGITFGQRVDLLADLLGGVGDARLPELATHWGSRVDEIRGMGYDGLALYLRSIVERDLEQKLSRDLEFRDVHSETLVLDAARNSRQVNYAVAASGLYMAVAIAERVVDVDMDVLLDGQPATSDTAYDYFPLGTVEAAAGQQLQLRVYTADPRVGAGTAVKLRIAYSPL